MQSMKNFGRTLWANLRNGRLSTTFGILAALSLGVLAGSMITGSVSAGGQHGVDSSDARPLMIPNPVTLSNGFSGIVKQVGPAVVNINTESLPKQSAVRKGRRNTPNGDNGSDQGDMQDFFNRFFGGQNPGGDGDGMPDGGERRALGSGFIVDPRGYIITNNHVVDKADRIYVKLSTDPESSTDNGRLATVVGVDKDTDIAVIKIDPKGLTLPTVKLGNSDGAQVGDWVLAIGSPFGLSKTVSAGIVSAKDRSIDDPDPNGRLKQFQRFIQTDAAINPGNSGGPLVDMAGEVIGMNTAIYTQSAGSEGVGFAMPSNTIASVYNMLIGPDHKVTRGSIGISFRPEPAAVSREYGFANGGVFVEEVTPGKGAAKAGIQPEDVIVSVDGKPIKDGDELVANISSRRVGSTVQLGYLRDGKLHTASVTIGDRSQLESDASGPGSENATPAQSDAGESKLGITVAAVPPQLASKLGIQGGVLINTVRPGSFADDIRLEKGFIIVEINKKPVPDEAAYRAIVSGLKSGQDAVFKVRVQGANAPAGATFFGGTLP